jgi:hypothetical protein
MRGLVFLGFVCLTVACGSDDDKKTGGTGPSGTGPGGTGPVGTGPGVIHPGTSPLVSSCTIFPADNPWNEDISGAAVSAKSATYIAKMAPTTKLHPDWGTTKEGYGMPITVGAGATPVPISWTSSWGPKESDPLPCAAGTEKFCYPIPSTAGIEGGGDAHLLYLDTTGGPGACTLYELYATQPFSGGGYKASNGAIFKLDSNKLRPDGWTSADAAGLPIMPGLVRYDEVKAGDIHHAIRFTMSQTQQGYIHPATHAAGKADTDLPPMGLRLRLKASVNISAPPEGMAIVNALKKYGLLLADNGSNWYLSGDQNDGWAGAIDNVKKALDQIHGSDFEVIETGAVSTSNL